MEASNQTQPVVTEDPSQGAEAMQHGLADRAETIHTVGKTRENLGKVVTGNEVTADAHGNLLFDQERKAIAGGDVAYKE